MPKMRLDLQEGFANDNVEVAVNGKTVLRGGGITSRRMVGLALSAEVDDPDGALEISVQVPTKNLSQTFSVEATPNLGISIQNGQLKIITSERRFGYA
jgi:hypothetical protein